MRSFHEFLNAAALMFVTDEDFQNTASASGLDWFNLPETLDSVSIARKYLNQRATRPHKSVIFEMRNEIRFLEAGAPNFRSVPSDIVALAHELKIQRERFAYQELGQKLLSEPERGRHLLDAFSPDFDGGVSSSAAEDLIPYMLAEHRERVKNKEAVISIKSFEMISAAIGGFNPERLIGVLGSTGFGKTNFGMNIALKYALTSFVGYVNMEMGYADMVKRMIVVGTQTTFAQYEAGEIPQSKVNELVESVRGRFHMTSGRPLSFPMIRAWAKSKKEAGLKMLIVDYDQKIELAMDRNTPEWKAIQKVMMSLEDLSKELKICVIVFAQVNREGEISGSHRATFSADTIISFEEHPTDGPVLWAKKNRHGFKNAGVRVDYDQATATITEIQSAIIDPRPKPKSDKPAPIKVTRSNYSAGARHD